MESPRPILFGKYCLLERISVGGMAEVFRARPLNRPGFDRFLALKRILPNLAADDEFITMFVDEAKIAVQLNHRAICQIYELGRLDGSFYIVMEYIAGRDLLALQNWFRKRKKIMSVVQAAHIAAEVCDGLDYAHRKVTDDGQPLNIIHRDVSPQNVIVGYTGEVKVIDFGIARAATTNQTTQVGVLKGKFGYMSPEQVDAKALDRRSDVFAVGTLLWEMLTARRLFHGDSDFATLEKVRSAEIEPPSARNPSVPAEIDRIVLKALARDLDERYAWASELAAELRAFVASAAADYGSEKLGGWMCRNFADEFETERGRLEYFRPFVTADDVVAFYRDHPDPLQSSVDDDPSTADEATRVALNDGAEVLAASRDGERGDVMAALPPAAARIFVDDEEMGAGGRDPMGAFAAGSATGAPPLALPDPSARRRSRKVAAFGVAALVALGVAFGVGVARLPAPTGTLSVSVTPAEGVDLYIDGALVEGTMPTTLEGLEPGRRSIELRADGYEPIVEIVEIEAGGVAQLERTLVSNAAAQAAVVLTVSDPRAEVYLGGAVVGGQGTTRTLALRAGARHAIEVYLPGHFVETIDIDAAPNGRYERSIEMRPVAGTITIASEPAGAAYIDGVARGTTEHPITIGELDPRLPYEVEVRPSSRSFKSFSQTVVFDTYYDIRLRPRLPRVGTADNDTPVTLGRITTSDAERWFRVFVDGRDTGLVTPIDASAPLALKSGDRAISFVRADERRDVRVRLDPGATLHVQIPTP